MAKAYTHALSSAKKFGGKPEDYINIHQWFDESKSVIGDNRHRVLRHHAFGIFECEKIFGPTITNGDGRIIPTRSIGEQHLIEDFGFIPTLQDYILSMKCESWMSGIGLPPSHPKRSLNNESRETGPENQAISGK